MQAIPATKKSDELRKNFDADEPEPGHYHLRIGEFKEYVARIDGAPHIVSMEVVGTSPEQESQLGKVHAEFFNSRPSATKPDSTWWADRLMVLAVACGLITQEELDRHVEEGTAPEFDWQKTVGRHVCAQFYADTYNGQERIKIAGRGFALYSLDDPESAGFPINRHLAPKKTRDSATSLV